MSISYADFTEWKSTRKKTIGGDLKIWRETSPQDLPKSPQIPKCRAFGERILAADFGDPVPSLLKGEEETLVWE